MAERHDSDAEIDVEDVMDGKRVSCSRVVPRHPMASNFFNEEEAALIMEKYVDNYCIYHKLEGRGKISESEKKKQFMSSLTEEVNALGFSIRTEKQIDQKIRDELKIVRKYAAALRRADASGGVASLPRLNRVQRFVYEALEHEPKVIGSYGEEPRRSSDLWRRKRRVFEEEAPYLEPQPTQQHSPRFVSKVKGRK